MTSDAGTNVLLLADASDHAATCAECDDLLAPGDDGAVCELRVTFSGADDRPDVSEAGGRRPDRKGLVSVGDAARSTAGDAPDFSGAVAVDAVEDPSDLQGIGIAVSEFCERWDDGTIVVCFDSLGAMLDHAEADVVFRFAHVLTKRLSKADARAHFHLDPDANDDRVVATFESIFDAVARPDRDDASPPAPPRHPDGDREATDEDIARLADDWEDDRFAVVQRRHRDGGCDRPDEATDEDIARLFDE